MAVHPWSSLLWWFHLPDMPVACFGEHLGELVKSLLQVERWGSEVVFYVRCEEFPVNVLGFPSWRCRSGFRDGN